MRALQFPTCTCFVSVLVILQALIVRKPQSREGEAFGIKRRKWVPQSREPPETQEHKDPGRDIPTTFLLNSWAFLL